MKVIFLDIDGVLNSQETAADWYEKTGSNGYGGFFKEEEPAIKENVIWGQKMVDNLKRIVQETGSQIVMSTTWRKYFSVDKFKEMFSLYGWENAPVIDKTPSGYKTRGLEIRTWLKDNPTDNYVIIDDFYDFILEQKDNVVETNPEVGLTEEDSNKAIKILNNGTL